MFSPRVRSAASSMRSLPANPHHLLPLSELLADPSVLANFERHLDDAKAQLSHLYTVEYERAQIGDADAIAPDQFQARVSVLVEHFAENILRDVKLTPGLTADVAVAFGQRDQQVLEKLETSLIELDKDAREISHLKGNVSRRDELLDTQRDRFLRELLILREMVFQRSVLGDDYMPEDWGTLLSEDDRTFFQGRLAQSAMAGGITTKEFDRFYRIVMLTMKKRLQDHRARFSEQYEAKAKRLIEKLEERNQALAKKEAEFAQRLTEQRSQWRQAELQAKAQAKTLKDTAIVELRRALERKDQRIGSLDHSYRQSLAIMGQEHQDRLAAALAAQEKALRLEFDKKFAARLLLASSDDAEMDDADNDNNNDASPAALAASSGNKAVRGPKHPRPQRLRRAGRKAKSPQQQPTSPRGKDAGVQEALAAAQQQHMADLDRLIEGHKAELESLRVHHSQQVERVQQEGTIKTVALTQQLQQLQQQLAMITENYNEAFEAIQCAEEPLNKLEHELELDVGDAGEPDADGQVVIAVPGSAAATPDSFDKVVTESTAAGRIAAVVAPSRIERLQQKVRRLVDELERSKAMFDLAEQRLDETQGKVRSLSITADGARRRSKLQLEDSERAAKSEIADLSERLAVAEAAVEDYRKELEEERYERFHDEHHSRVCFEDLLGQMLATKASVQVQESLVGRLRRGIAKIFAKDALEGPPSRRRGSLSRPGSPSQSSPSSPSPRPGSPRLTDAVVTQIAAEAQKITGLGKEDLGDLGTLLLPTHDRGSQTDSAAGGRVSRATSPVFFIGADPSAASLGMAAFAAATGRDSVRSLRSVRSDAESAFERDLGHPSRARFGRPRARSRASSRSMSRAQIESRASTPQSVGRPGSVDGRQTAAGTDSVDGRQTAAGTDSPHHSSAGRLPSMPTLPLAQGPVISDVPPDASAVASPAAAAADTLQPPSNAKSLMRSASEPTVRIDGDDWAGNDVLFDENMAWSAPATPEPDDVGAALASISAPRIQFTAEVAVQADLGDTESVEPHFGSDAEDGLAQERGRGRGRVRSNGNRGHGAGRDGAPGTPRDGPPVTPRRIRVQRAASADATRCGGGSWKGQFPGRARGTGLLRSQAETVVSTPPALPRPDFGDDAAASGAGDGVLVEYEYVDLAPLQIRGAQGGAAASPRPGMRTEEPRSSAGRAFRLQMPALTRPDRPAPLSQDYFVRPRLSYHVERAVSALSEASSADVGERAALRWRLLLNALWARRAARLKALVRMHAKHVAGWHGIDAMLRRWSLADTRVRSRLDELEQQRHSSVETALRALCQTVLPDQLIELEINPKVDWVRHGGGGGGGGGSGARGTPRAGTRLGGVFKGGLVRTAGRA